MFNKQKDKEGQRKQKQRQLHEAGARKTKQKQKQKHPKADVQLPLDCARVPACLFAFHFQLSASSFLCSVQCIVYGFMRVHLRHLQEEGKQNDGSFKKECTNNTQQGITMEHATQTIQNGPSEEDTHGEGGEMRATNASSSTQDNTEEKYTRRGA